MVKRAGKLSDGFSSSLAGLLGHLVSGIEHLPEGQRPDCCFSNSRHPRRAYETGALPREIPTPC